MRKTILVGLDGATWKNLMKWIKEDKLPFFKKIITEGVYGINNTTIPSLTSPALPSLFTGKSPAETGIFGFRKSDGSILSFKDIKERCFWDILAEKGFSSLVVGARITYPPKINKGVLVSGGILAPSDESKYVYPETYKEVFKGYKEKMDQDFFTELKKKNGYKKLLTILKNKFSIIQNFLKQKNFDFVFLWIGETDLIQHKCWHKQDELLKFYQGLDKLLDGFVDTKNNYLFISDHGFGPGPSYTFNINSWLRDENFLELNKSIKFIMHNKISSSFNKMARSGGWFLRKTISIYRYEKIAKRYMGLIRKNSKKNIVLDPCKTNIKLLNPKKSNAYLDQAWGISLLKKSVEDYEKQRTKIIQKLKALEYKGIKVVKEAYPREKIYSGKHISEIPDIIFVLDQRFEAGADFDKEVFSNITEDRGRTGAHENERKGIFMAIGPDIKKNKQINTEIYDFAPTILHAYNIPIPKSFTGKVLKNIFKNGSKLAMQDIVYQKENKLKNVISKLEV